jgi:hypothetical protein
VAGLFTQERTMSDDLAAAEQPTSADLLAAREAAGRCLVCLNVLVHAARDPGIGLLPALEALERATGSRPPGHLLGMLLTLPLPHRRCAELLTREEALTHAGVTAPSAHILAFRLGAQACTTAFQAVCKVRASGGPWDDWCSDDTGDLWGPSCPGAVGAAIGQLPEHDPDYLWAELEVEHSRGQRRLAARAAQDHPKHDGPSGQPTQAPAVVPGSEAPALVDLASPATINEQSIPYTSPLSAPDLARLLRDRGCSATTDDAVGTYLRRYRVKYPDCCVTVDDDDRRRNTPRYLYRPEVWPYLVEHFARAESSVKSSVMTDDI